MLSVLPGKRDAYILGKSRYDDVLFSQTRTEWNRIECLPQNFKIKTK